MRGPRSDQSSQLANEKLLRIEESSFGIGFRIPAAMLTCGEQGRREVCVALVKSDQLSTELARIMWL